MVEGSLGVPPTAQQYLFLVEVGLGLLRRWFSLGISGMVDEEEPRITSRDYAPQKDFITKAEKESVIDAQSRRMGRVTEWGTQDVPSCDIQEYEDGGVRSVDNQESPITHE